MPNFTFTRDTPFATHNPSSDQPIMQTNTNSEDSIWAVDHHGFNDNLGGYHNVIHQDPQLANPAPIAGIGQTFVKTVGSDVQLFYESGLGVVTQLSNSSSILPRVAVNFNGQLVNGVCVLNSSFNVTNVTRLAIGNYIVNFTNALSSQFYYPAIVAQQGVGAGPGVSNITTSGAYTPTTTTLNVSFLNSSGAFFDPVFSSVIIFL